jgi:hypothetical protein
MDGVLAGQILFEMKDSVGAKNLYSKHFSKMAMRHCYWWVWVKRN